MRIIILFVATLWLNVALTQDSNTNWFTDSEETISYAKSNDTKILMVFSGSDWCRPCIQFKNDILKNEVFESYAQDKLAILYLDFPSKKKNRLSKEATKHNEALAEKYNKSGSFPKVILLDADFTKIKTLEHHQQTAESFLQKIQG